MKALLAEMEKIAKKPPSSGDSEEPPEKTGFFSKRKKDPVEREAVLVFQRVAMTVIVTLTLYIVGFSYIWVLLAALAVYGIFWLLSVRSRKKILADAMGADEMVSVGTYISGFSRVRQSFLGAVCLITEPDFVFICQDGEELGRIPRNAVSRVGVKEGERILQHLPFYRMLTLGAGSLVGRGLKANRPYHLLIEWRSEAGERQFAVFEYTGPQAARDAYRAVNILYRNLAPRSGSRKDSNRK